jgi:hypothetical protein
MEKTKSLPGICPSCNNIETCASRPGYRLPVYYCEQFDSSPESAAEMPAVSAAEAKEKINIALGLCCNCDKRNSCIASLTPGGIWHCEEYF